MVFPRDMICLRNISIDTLHKGDTEDDDDDDDDDNNNNNNNNNNGERVAVKLCLFDLTQVKERRVALSRTCRCTEFHRVKNANLRHPSAVC